MAPWFFSNSIKNTIYRFSPLRYYSSSVLPITVSLFVLFSALYHLSPRIRSIQHATAGELVDSLSRKQILADQETNDIIKIMSGLITQKDFDNLLVRHGYKNVSIEVGEILCSDVALYKTIVHMQNKYGNPKLSFSGDFWNYEEGINESSRPRFSYIRNTIYLHQLDSVIPIFSTVDCKTSCCPTHQKTWQSYLINNRIAELAHAKQGLDHGRIKMYIHHCIDYVLCGFDYDRTYITPGTCEYQTHTILEPSLIQEFISCYKKYMDTNSIICQKHLYLFTTSFFNE